MAAMPWLPCQATRMALLLAAAQVTVNGREISAAAVQRKFYFALNKPKGYICRCAAGLLRSVCWL